LHGFQACSTGALSQRQQDGRQALSQQAQNAQLPDVQKVKRIDALLVAWPRGQAVDGAQGEHNRQGAALQSKVAARTGKLVVRMQDGGRSLRIKG